jgi:hypothetical protein
MTVTGSSRRSGRCTVAAVDAGARPVAPATSTVTSTERIGLKIV